MRELHTASPDQASGLNIQVKEGDGREGGSEGESGTGGGIEGKSGMDEGAKERAGWVEGAKERMCESKRAMEVKTTSVLSD